MSDKTEHLTSREAKGDLAKKAHAFDVLIEWGHISETIAYKALEYVEDTYPAAQEAAKTVVPEDTRELACEGLDYFEKAGDAGDREYIRAIREWLASESHTYKAMIAAVQEVCE